jgi:hypothetical protein
MNEQAVPVLIDNEINPQILQRARYEIGGLQFCNRDGIGSVPDVDNIGYMGAVILMKPSQFLRIVAPLGNFTRTVSYLKTSRPPLFGTPFLDINIDAESGTAQVKGHEGRSRMTFFKEVTGDISIPVALFLRENNSTLRARHIEPWMLELVQAGLFSERTERNKGDYIEGPVFDQAIYFDKSSKIARISSPEREFAPSF